jgi:hypothetical protein
MLGWCGWQVVVACQETLAEQVVVAELQVVVAEQLEERKTVNVVGQCVEAVVAGSFSNASTTSTISLYSA